MTAAQPRPGAGDGLWVRSELLPTGVYAVAVSVGEDRAWTLPRDQAIAYATECLRRCTEAEHAAAVLSLLTGRLGVPMDDASQALLHDFRVDRPDADVATAPLQFRAVMGRRRSTGDLVPFVAMSCDGRPAGELTIADLREHAVYVFSVLAAAELDETAYRALVRTYGLDEPRARAVVNDLGAYWPGPDRPRSSA